MPIIEFSSVITNDASSPLQMQCASRQFTLIIDEPVAYGGEDSGVNPIEALLVSIGACKGIVAKSFARLHRVNLKNIRIEMKGEIDPDGYMGKNKRVKIGLSRISTHYFIQADNTKEEIQTFINFIEHTCPLSDTIKNAPIFHTFVEIE
ncbi:OsmC family protein [Proteus terrae]|uniref:OsmC family protein n=1 Tax=Proteus terrae TaxID=1574161 RepID=UPI003BF78B2C